jgi:4-hydroxybenzoate polyprenyltransferase
MASEIKKKRMKQGLIIGAAVGVALFVMAYTMNPSLIYLFFIPLAALMGWGMQYVKEENVD